jgi:hypothetical protein
LDRAIAAALALAHDLFADRDTIGFRPGPILRASAQTNLAGLCELLEVEFNSRDVGHGPAPGCSGNLACKIFREGRAIVSNGYKQHAPLVAKMSIDQRGLRLLAEDRFKCCYPAKGQAPILALGPQLLRTTLRAFDREHIARPARDICDRRRLACTLRGPGRGQQQAGPDQ